MQAPSFSDLFDSVFKCTVCTEACFRKYQCEKAIWIVVILKEKIDVLVQFIVDICF